MRGFVCFKIRVVFSNGGYFSAEGTVATVEILRCVVAILGNLGVCTTVICTNTTKGQVGPKLGSVDGNIVGVANFPTSSYGGLVLRARLSVESEKPRVSSSFFVPITPLAPGCVMMQFLKNEKLPNFGARPFSPKIVFFGHFSRESYFS